MLVDVGSVSLNLHAAHLMYSCAESGSELMPQVVNSFSFNFFVDFLRLLLPRANLDWNLNGRVSRDTAGITGPGFRFYIYANAFGASPLV